MHDVSVFEDLTSAFRACTAFPNRSHKTRETLEVLTVRRRIRIIENPARRPAQRNEMTGSMISIS
jgi:hypothetical protein